MKYGVSPVASKGMTRLWSWDEICVKSLGDGIWWRESSLWSREPERFLNVSKEKHSFLEEFAPNFSYHLRSLFSMFCLIYVPASKISQIKFFWTTEMNNLNWCGRDLQLCFWREWASEIALSGTRRHEIMLCCWTNTCHIVTFAGRARDNLNLWKNRQAQ